MMEEIKNIIKNFPNKKILVIGDAMLDVYLRGTSKRICREAPVPIVEIRKKEMMPGGAANTAYNIAKLGAESVFISSVGRDSEGDNLRKLLTKSGVNCAGVYSDRRATIVKQRVMAGDHMLVRFDTDSAGNISSEVEDSVIVSLTKYYPAADAVILSDYAYGVLTPKVLAALKRLQEIYSKPLVVDAKYLSQYAGFHPTLVKPNFEEAVLILGIEDIPAFGKRATHMRLYGQDLIRKTGAKIVALTLDIEGSLIFYGKNIYSTRTTPVANSKAAGAGDTYTCAFTLAFASGSDVSSAGKIASAAAEIVVSQDMTAVASRKELLSYFSPHRKLVEDAEDLIPIVESAREEGRRIVFTNGCFDILHSGHVDYLRRAKELGEVLVLGINTDRSVRKLKGKGRPVNSLYDRVDVLSGLESVDYIVPFDSNTPISLIRKLSPDIYVKGGDYTRERLPEVPYVEEYGGRVVILPFKYGHSTTNIIDKIRSNGHVKILS